MKTSTDFILTTHVGSLPRPKALEEKLLKQEMGVLSEEEAATMPAEVSDAVKWAVQRQPPGSLLNENPGSLLSATQH